MEFAKRVAASQTKKQKLLEKMHFCGVLSALLGVPITAHQLCALLM